MVRGCYDRTSRSWGSGFAGPGSRGPTWNTFGALGTGHSRARSLCSMCSTSRARSRGVSRSMPCFFLHVFAQPDPHDSAPLCKTTQHSTTAVPHNIVRHGSTALLPHTAQYHVAVPYHVSTATPLCSTTSYSTVSPPRSTRHDQQKKLPQSGKHLQHFLPLR